MHAVSHLLNSTPGDQHNTLLLDFSNAFNNISWEAMFAQFCLHLPGLSPWIEFCYSCQPILLTAPSRAAATPQLAPSQCDPSNSPLLLEISMTQSGFTLLGYPINPPAYCEEVMQAKVNKVKESLSVRQDLGSLHIETTLLRSCLVLPKMSYILPTRPHQQAMSSFGATLRETLNAILDGPLTKWSC